MERLNRPIDDLYEDSRALWVPQSVQEHHGQGELVPFLRDHVSQSVPCVWRACASEWRALELWPHNDFKYLREKVGEKLIQVAVTPNGRADAILKVQRDSDGVEKAFAMPYQQTQRFNDLLDSLRDVPSAHDALGRTVICNGAEVAYAPYYSAQDSSLTREVPELLDDIDQSTIRFAELAFGSKPSATNIWIGDGRSLTTMHADPFENMYVVISGTKMFELRPPCDAVMLPKPALKCVRWVPVSESGETARENVDGVRTVTPCIEYKGWRLKEEEGMTEWIDEDGIKEEWRESLKVTLDAGDLLYLPALWCT